MLAARAGGAVIGAACIVYSAALANHPRSVAFFAGAAAVALISATVTLRAGAIGAAMALVAVAYGYGLLRGTVDLDGGAPLVGVGVLLVGELLELARAGEGRVTDKEVWRGRLLFLLAVTAGGAAVGLAALLVGGASRVAGPGLLLLAAGAAVLALLSVVRLVQSLLAEDAGEGAGNPSGAPPPIGGR